MGDSDLTALRALALADEAPYLPIPGLLARGVDLVLCLGDLTRHDLEALADVQLPKLGVFGNHDDGGEFEGLGIENVHLRSVELCGLTFGGFSGSHEYRPAKGTRLMWSQKQASKLLDRFGHVDVMLAHSPPLGVNDDADDPAHVGLQGLRDYVEREHPAMLLHGHTYPPLPVERLGDTQVRHVRGHRFVALPGAQSAASDR
jgi:Icc-related predicted phosphoesterase